MSFHTCTRCSGAGWICSGQGCGRTHSPPGHFRNKPCKRCGSRARPVRCPGLVAGQTMRGPWGQPEGLVLASRAHFESFVDCDCCGVMWVGNYKPSNWPTVKRLGKDIVLCHDCAAHHELLVSMALEQLFTERERANVGKTYG